MIVLRSWWCWYEQGLNPYYGKNNKNLIENSTIKNRNGDHNDQS